MLRIKKYLREFTPSTIWLMLSSLKKVLKLDRSVPMFFVNRYNSIEEEKIFVLGNGPSLKNDMQLLSDDSIFFCVNNFSTSPYYSVLKPKYYLFLDSYFFSESSHQDWVEQRNKTFDAIDKQTSWNMTIYVPSWANLKFIEASINNKFIKIIKLRVGDFDVGSKMINKLAYNTGIFGPHQVNVLIYAIYISIWLKAKEIVVLGADTSFHSEVSVDQFTNELSMNFSHFNDEPSKKLLMKNPCKTQPFTMFEIMDTCSKTFGAHDMLNYFAKSKSCTIYNASSYSLIDAYERTNLNVE